MTWIIIAGVVIVVLMIAQNAKTNKEINEKLKQEKEQREQDIRERKKDGEPKVSEALPLGAEAVKERLTGADGKEYPDPRLFADTIVLAYFGKMEHHLKDKYEYNPVYGMLAMEQFIREYVERLQRPVEMHPNDQNNGIACIYELAENYAYPVPAQDDMTRAEHYTVRRLEDRKRAMEGNGYYKNAYGFPVNYKKAVEYYDLAEVLRASSRITNIDMEHAGLIARCWMQSAHIYSAGSGGVAGDTDRAKGLYDRAFQMAMRQSWEDMAVEIIHAITQGYPRDPEIYITKAPNMLADWACRSDFGLAMYAEYLLHVKDLDRKRLAESPQSVAQLCRELAADNCYAAYMLGRAMLYGYGTQKDEAGGRRLLELAAEGACISALSLLKNLACGNPEEEKKWNTKLSETVAAIASKCGPLRDFLKESGKNVTDKAKAEFESKMSALQKQEEWQTLMREEEEAWKPESGGTQDGRNEDLSGEEQSAGFAFPQYLYDDDGNPWELMNSGWDIATYYCQKTGGQVTLYASDFDEDPSGFHRRD